MKYLHYLLLSSTFVITACAGSQSNSAYVSSDHYSDYNCIQLKAEKKRISSKLEQMTEVDTEEKESNVTSEVLGAAIMGYAISQGYGFQSNEKSDVPFRRLQNQYDVLEQTLIEKQCF